MPFVQFVAKFPQRTYALGSGMSPAMPKCWIRVPAVEGGANHVELEGRKTAASFRPSPLGGSPLGEFYGVGAAIDVVHDGVEDGLGFHTFLDFLSAAGGGADGYPAGLRLGRRRRFQERTHWRPEKIFDCYPAGRYSCIYRHR